VWNILEILLRGIIVNLIDIKIVIEIDGFNVFIFMG